MNSLKTLKAGVIAIGVFSVSVASFVGILNIYKAHTEKVRQASILRQAKETKEKYWEAKWAEMIRDEDAKRKKNQEEYKRKNALEIANKIISISYDGIRRERWDAKWDYEGGGWKLELHNKFYDGGNFELCKQIIVAFRLHNKSTHKISNVHVLITALGKYNEILLTEDKWINIAKEEGYPLDIQSNCFLVEYTKGIDLDYSKKIRHVEVALIGTD